MDYTNEQKIDEAIKHLEDAYVIILKVLETESSGADLSESYIDTLHEVSAEILKQKRKL
jgi:hypothetical protein